MFKLYEMFWFGSTNIVLTSIVNEVRQVAPVIRSWLQPIMNFRDSIEIGYELLSKVEYVDDVAKFFSGVSDADIAELVKEQIYQMNRVCESGRIPMRKRLFVNIRTSTIADSNFVQWLCSQSRLPLALEIDYLDLLNQPDLRFNTDNLNFLRKHGHQIWLDDYTCDFNNHSCFDVLSNPWDGIKIDKTVLWHSCYDYDELREIVERCKELCEVVLIEGVESEQHVSACRNAKVDLGQGFYWQDRLVF
ncbi:EAL domain-containing protein [Shewanella algae]|uniref:EAL domain-containing protein n=1 Tax=Shewanella algae TaxID=38313 RepID=UPI0013DE1865|nr:EAL domain-containing protein [Shewanella algae]